MFEPFKEMGAMHDFKVLTQKFVFSKIEQDVDVGKTTKTAPHERTYFSRCPSPKMSRIGSLSMKLSSNNDQAVISGYLRQKS